MTQSQKIIIAYLQQVQRDANLEELYKISDRNYYANWRKNFGVFMSAMVKSRLVERVKPGVFRLGKRIINTQESDPNQISLF